MWIPLVERSLSLKLGKVSLLGMRVTPLLIYNPATKNVIRSQNVKFNELWLPSHSLSAKNLGENNGFDDDSVMEIQFAESRTPAPAGEQIVNRHSHDNSDSHVSGSTNGTPGSGEKTPNSYPLCDLFTVEEDAEDGAEPQPGFTWVEPGADDPLAYEPPCILTHIARLIRYPPIFHRRSGRHVFTIKWKQ